MEQLRPPERSDSPPRTLYRLIDEGALPGYRLGRVIRLKTIDIETFVQASRIQPGELAHLYVNSADSEAF